MQRLLGHKNVATTQRYDKRNERQLAEKRRGEALFTFAATAPPTPSFSTRADEVL